MALAWEPTKDTYHQAWDPRKDTHLSGFGTCSKETARGWPCTAIGRDP